MEKFYTIITFLILLSTLMTITSINPIHSVFWLVVVFLQSSFLLLSLGFDFIGLILVIIYVGAIAILFLFVIMMLDIYQLKKSSIIFHVLPLVFLVVWYFLTLKQLKLEFSFLWLLNWNTTTSSHLFNLSDCFYSEFVLPFIVLSLLLLVAMVGAIILTLESGILTRKQFLSRQHHRNNS